MSVKANLFNIKDMFMKMFFLLIFTMLFFCGCHETAIINGQRFEVLSEREERTLVLLAKDSLKNSPNTLSDRDHYACMTTEPKLEIKYMADRSGQAKVIWKLHDKRVIIGFAGEFLTKGMQWIMYTEPVDTAIVDGRNPDSAAGKTITPSQPRRVKRNRH